MLMRHHSEERLLVRVDAILVTVVDKGTNCDSTNDAECCTSVDAAVRLLLLSSYFFGHGGES